MSEQIELRECPAGHKTTYIPDESHYNGRCASCGWQGPRRDNRTEAVLAWNRRAAREQPVAPTEYDLHLRAIERRQAACPKHEPCKHGPPQYPYYLCRFCDALLLLTPEEITASQPGGEMSLEAACSVLNERQHSGYTDWRPHGKYFKAMVSGGTPPRRILQTFEVLAIARAYLRDSEPTGLAGLVQGATAYQDMVGRVFGEPAWISVAKRLPEGVGPAGWVLVWGSSSVVEVGRCRDGSRWVDVMENTIKPTHWQPLPAPPEAAEVKA